ncbi:protein SMIM7 homolog [Littorina saxatilis]|uniref:Small integral membrane protein 7 n=1 Tax=Littorina saxatilis TaxID=31220 RepID=A0AAN9AM42_9CAEN
MLSEIVICGTLLMNAGAILNFRLRKSHDEGAFGAVADATLGDKVREFLLSLRTMRVFIGLWNVFIMFLMLVFFAH